MTAPTPAPAPVATQTRHPWRATVRTVFAGAGAVTRVLALPGVETWLRTYVPWLAAAPQEVQP